jgi:hypothetical protein
MRQAGGPLIDGVGKQLLFLLLLARLAEDFGAEGGRDGGLLIRLVLLSGGASRRRRPHRRRRPAGGGASVASRRRTCASSPPWLPRTRGWVELAAVERDG